METHKVKYDTDKFPFGFFVATHFGWEKHLDQLHEWLDEDVPLFEDKTFDQSTGIHKHFYKIYENNDNFLNLYKEFLKDVVQPHIGGSIVYQARPTFRICLPGNKAVGEWHKDSDYNHQRSEITWWLPFTDAFGNNTVWAESEEDKGDYEPLRVDFGEVLVWKSSYLRHGNKPNNTGVSRVSMDFRVIPHEEYKSIEASSSHMKLKFELGSYYELMEG